MSEELDLVVVGSGGSARRALEGKGPTPPAEMRKGHPAARRATASAARARSAATTESVSR